MSSLFTSLSSAARALDAQRYSLDVTGQNIANVNTPGNSRRVIDMAAVPPETDRAAGRGVDVVGVRSARDVLLERRLQQELPAERREAALADALSIVEAGLGRPGESIDAALDRFFNARLQRYRKCSRRRSRVKKRYCRPNPSRRHSATWRNN